MSYIQCFQNAIILGDLNLIILKKLLVQQEGLWSSIQDISC